MTEPIMDLQDVLVAVVALIAAGYLARQAWRTWAGASCSGGCCKNAVPAARVPRKARRLRRERWWFIVIGLR